MPLSDKQQRFVTEYLVDLNGAAAYRRAGYKVTSDHAASAHAARLVANGSIQAAIQEARERQEQRTEITSDRILKELACLSYIDPADVLDFSGIDPRLKPANMIPERARRAIASIETKRYTEGAGDAARQVEITKFKFWDKPACLEKLGKHKGLFPNRVEVTGANGAPLVTVVEFVRQDERPQPDRIAEHVANDRHLDYQDARGPATGNGEPEARRNGSGGHPER